MTDSPVEVRPVFHLDGLARRRCRGCFDYGIERRLMRRKRGENRA